MHKSNPADLEDWAAKALFLVRMREREWKNEGDHYDETRWSHRGAWKMLHSPLNLFFGPLNLFLGPHSSA